MSPSSEKTNGGAATLGQFETLRAVEQFLYRQADILDDRKWDDWLGLFTEDGHYWMPVSDDQTVADGVPNIFYEDLDLMRVRAKRVTHPHAWSQQPGHRTSHVVSNVVIDEEQPETGDVVVRSKFHVVEYWNDGLRHFAGRYRHELTNTPDGYRIRVQRVDLINADGPFDYVIQTWV
ncbi:MAG: aromatic-ring-hydroxylating dioxygenase subunit beta [Proteobacteria bacterium]|nr:aromatic-ring-hydroxylating dioxygenase subunit beta [Pseudomonadota bacterium]